MKEMWQWEGERKGGHRRQGRWETGQMRAGGPAAPFSQGRSPSPQPVGGSLSTTKSSVSYHHATAEAAGNGSTPCIFTHSTPQYGQPGQIITVHMYGGQGRGEVYVGEGVKHKASGPGMHARTGNSPCQLQAEVTELDVCRSTKYWKTLLKTIAPPNSGGRGGQFLRGLPLGPFQVMVPMGMLGTLRSLPHLS